MSMSESFLQGIAIAAGGALGSLARWQLAAGWVRLSALCGWPVHTWLINLLACAILGAWLQWTEDRPAVPAWLRFGIGTGFCGGFSTFSTVGAEMWQLVRTGQGWTGTGYGLLSLLGCLLATAAGYWLARIAR